MTAIPPARIPCGPTPPRPPDIHPDAAYLGRWTLHYWGQTQHDGGPKRPAGGSRCDWFPDPAGTHHAWRKGLSIQLTKVHR